MEVYQLTDVLVEVGRRLGDAAGSCSMDAQVPTCADWTVRDLLRHVGGVHRWAASYLETGRNRPTSLDEDAEFFVQVPDENLLSWYREGHAALVSTLESTDPSKACWTFLPAASPLAFWARRQAHETAIHCADAEASARRDSLFAVEVAADGIDELLNGFFARPNSPLRSDSPLALGIRGTDSDVAWTVRVGRDGPTVTAGVEESDCLVSGATSDLYLLLWNRCSAQGLEVAGDTQVLELWKEKAHIIWS